MRPVFVAELLGEIPEGFLACLARRAAEDAHHRAGRVGRARDQHLGSLVRGGDKPGEWGRMACHSRGRMRTGPGK